MYTDHVKTFMSLYVQSLLAEKANKRQIADVLEERMDRVKDLMSFDDKQLINAIEEQFFNDTISFDELYLTWAGGITTEENTRAIYE